MEKIHLYQKSASYLKMLCEEIAERSVGSEGNRQATRFFAETISALGWQTEVSELEVMDWHENGASLQIADQCFNVLPVSGHSKPASNGHFKTGHFQHV